MRISDWSSDVCSSDLSLEMRRLLTALLSVMGIGEVICASDGIAGLRLFSECAPDLVITDGTMQPMDGYEMTRAIRATHNPGDPPGQGGDVPVLMLSGHMGDRKSTRLNSSH